jgi:16S rRNA (guanine966-N2)-methyltransferase
MARKPGLRVTAGTARGRVLVLVPGAGTRPTSAMLREAIFASLAGVDGLRVLDLCSGSGLLAIEALSRGATHATCIDSAGAAIRTIHANLRDVGFTDLATVLRRRADLYLKKTDQRYDLLLADPPYADAALAAAIVTLAPAALAPEGRLVLEHPSRSDPPEAPPGIELDRTRSHGDSAYTISHVIDRRSAPIR